MAPSLSELRSQLRQKGTGAQKTATAGESPEKRGLEDAEAGDEPPQKRVAQAPKASVAKSGGAVRNKSAPGLSAKMPGMGSVSPPPSPEMDDGDAASGTSTNSSGAISKRPGVPVMASMVKRPPSGPPQRDGDLMPPPTDGVVSPATISDLIAGIEASPTGAKQRHLVRLAEAIGQSLQIENINQFLRALKTKVIERAKGDGIQAPHASAAPKAFGGSPMAAKSAPPKAAIAKVSVPVVTKAAAPKAIAKVAAKSSVPKAAVAKSSPAATPPDSPADEGLASPPASPPPSDDALYNLVGSLTEDPVIEDGVIREARLGEVFKQLWGGVARKPKDWVAAWQAMSIPVDKQSEALQKLLNIAFLQIEDPDRAPLIVAELVKTHKVKMISMQDVLVTFGHNLDGILAMNEEAWHVYSKLLVHIFPKPANTGWGWSRVGWNWMSWWQFVEKCCSSLEQSRAFDVLGLILRLIQDREGQSLTQIQMWMDGDKLAKVLAKLCELGGCEQAEVIERLSLCGVSLDSEDGGQEEA
eukprot:TRINITY_DN19904_c0_g1_i2.p1 TRINITY_DN19904_c0_g1~~TRINITY_DN19904_c0_g1_i2.p1  ORF type:complete len:555 (+),score=127.01 TRINITY_DN19904_c0_g1_i2:87-1667(+)